MAEIIASFGWPHFSFLFALICVVYFRSELKGLIGRVTSIDRSGIKAQPNPEAQREDAKKSEAVQELLLAVGNTVVLQEIEGRIKNDLTQRDLSIEGDTVKVLIKHLAAALVAIRLEQIHNLIFGSQIALLKKLNEVTGQGQTLATVQAHFDYVKNVFADGFENWSLDDYLKFLFSRELITTEGDRYHITNLGKEYLVWAARNGKSENNPL